MTAFYDPRADWAEEDRVTEQPRTQVEIEARASDGDDVAWSRTLTKEYTLDEMIEAMTDTGWIVFLRDETSATLVSGGLRATLGYRPAGGAECGVVRRPRGAYCVGNP